MRPMRTSFLPAMTLLIALAAGAALAAGPQPAQDQAPATPQAKPGDKPPPAMDPGLRDNMLERFANMTGAWFINQRCNQLTPSLRRELEWSIEQTGKALVREVGSARLSGIEHNARGIADKQACGPETLKLTTSIMALARETVGFLSGLTYTPKLGLANDGNRIIRIRFAQMLDDKCKIMPEAVRREFDDRLQRVMDDFAADAGASMSEKIDRAADAAMSKNHPGCDDKAKRFAEQALAVVRLMSPGWKQAK